MLETLAPNLVRKMSELGLDEQKVLYDLRKKFTKLISVNVNEKVYHLTLNLFTTLTAN